MGYNFVRTKDGTVGLFDEDVNDIYHSSLGAYSEALEKFVIPAQIERFKDKTCKVLDICFGIGYNTKALLKYSLEKKYNISFKIDAIELNKELIELSPFIKNHSDIYDIEIDKFLLNSLLKNNIIDFNKIITKIRDNKYYLTQNKPNFNQIFEKYGYKYNILNRINAFLHNIYYHNISIRQIKGQKSYNFNKSTIEWHINDARKTVLNLSGEYNLIFLDAFTASKQPLLWTKQFINELSQLLNKSNGMIISYSTSSPFRNALLHSGLKIGKFYLEKINTTLASYNDVLLKYKLDEFELGLLDTRAGIMYEDENLDSSCNIILKTRAENLINSNLESTSRYYKRYNKKYGKH